VEGEHNVVNEDTGKGEEVGLVMMKGKKRWV